MKLQRRPSVMALSLLLGIALGSCGGTSTVAPDRSRPSRQGSGTVTVEPGFTESPLVEPLPSVPDPTTTVAPPPIAAPTTTAPPQSATPCRTYRVAGTGYRAQCMVADAGDRGGRGAGGGDRHEQRLPTESG